MKPVTIIETPPLLLIGVRVYNTDDYGKYVVGEVISSKINDNLHRKINPPNSDNYDSKNIQKRGTGRAVGPRAGAGYGATFRRAA